MPVSSRTFCEGWLGLGEGLTLVTGGCQSASPLYYCLLSGSMKGLGFFLLAIQDTEARR